MARVVHGYYVETASRATTTKTVARTTEHWGAWGARLPQPFERRKIAFMAPSWRRSLAEATVLPFVLSPQVPFVAGHDLVAFGRTISSRSRPLAVDEPPRDLIVLSGSRSKRHPSRSRRAAAAQL